MGFVKKAMLGIDIGTQNIKIVQINKLGRVDGWVIDPMPRGLFKNDLVVSEEALGGHIKMILERNLIKTRNCALCLPAKNVTYKVVTLPEMDKKIAISHLQHELQNYLSKDISDYIIDYRVIKNHVQNGINYWDILGVAVEKDVLKTYQWTLLEAGLKPKYIDIPVNCLQKILVTYVKTEKIKKISTGSICLVDIGLATMKIIILDKGNYYVDRIISLRNSKSKSKDNLDQVIYKAIVDVINFFNNRGNCERKIKDVLLCGGRVFESGLLDIGVKTTPVNLHYFSQWIDRSKFPNSWGNPHICILANAIGATIRRSSS